MATHGHRSAPTQRLRGNEWRVLRILAPYVLESISAAIGADMARRIDLDG